MTMRRCLAGFRTGILALLASMALCAGAAPLVLEQARDLAADGKITAATRQPIVILVSLAGCPHCEVVRRSHLLPLVKEDASGVAPLIRQIEFNGPQRVIDFAGKAISHAEFARRYQVKLAPVVLFFAPDGEVIADPLVGAMIPDFYGAYFDAALAQARAKLEKTIRP